MIGVAGAPLAIRFWEAFWSLPHAGRIVLCGAGLIVIVVATARRSSIPWSQRTVQARLGTLIALAWATVIIVVLLMVAGAWWIMGTPKLDFPDALPPGSLDALATRAFAVVAALGAAALLVIHYRRQRTTEAAAEREVTKLFNERFTAAYTELGSDHAAVRLGAVHALAHLADDAPSEEEVQMVIDVLCAYLRMPYAPVPGPLPEGAIKEEAAEHRERELEFASLREVRHTIIRIIGNHLREPTRWRGKEYDFTGVVFDGGDLSGAVFSSGRVSFTRARFEGGARIFHEARFSGATVNFQGALFGEGGASFAYAEFSGGSISFHLAKFPRGLTSFAHAKFSSGVVYMTHVEFTGSALDISHTEFMGATVIFSGSKFTGGEVSFSHARFSGGRVDFTRSVFAPGNISFGGAKFVGGEVDFTGVVGVRPESLIKNEEDVSSGVVHLSEMWDDPGGDDAQYRMEGGA